MLLCSVRSYPPLGINYTGLPLSWTHRPHLPTLVAQCHSSLLRNSLVSSCSGCSGMTHCKVVVELGFLLEAVVSIPCCFYSPPEPTRLCSQPLLSSLWAGHFPFQFVATKSQSFWASDVVRIIAPSVEGLGKTRSWVGKGFPFH